jgi:3-hydroxybutyryl-CoA dehydrogenase
MSSGRPDVGVPQASRAGRIGSVAAMEIREAAVVGLGTMGAGIAEVLGRAGIAVVAIEVDEDALARGVAILDASLARAVSRGKLTEAERDSIRGRIRPTTAFSDAARADLAIEVVPEQMALKRQVFSQLDRVCSPEAILATNTSSLSVTSIAAATTDPDRVVGLHFFNPAPVMRLVEVVSTVLTADGLADGIADLARRLGKTPVQVGDRAGFVANALLLPYLNHAVRLLETGYATRADIDLAATAGLGLPMGPLALLDLIGLDTSLSILEVLHAELGGSRYLPAALLRRLVTAGRTGRKAGRGIYDYAASGTDRNGAGVPAGGYGGSSPRADRRAAGPGGGAAGTAAAAPGTVTLIGSGSPAEAELASAAAAAGINVTRNPAHASDLVVIAAAPDERVLPTALETGRPGHAVGLHLAASGLAEVISTRLTGGPAAAAGLAFADRLGLQAVQAPDRPGFLVGALLYPHLADAVRMVQDGYASAADVDTAMTLGCGYPAGPFQLLDKTGPQVVLDGLRAMHAADGDPAFAPPPLLAEHAAAALGFAG